MAVTLTWHAIGSAHRQELLMIWFFERESERLQYEIRREMTGDGYELVVRESSARKVEMVTSPAELIERSQNVWMGLLSGGWRPLPSQDPASL
jgi:hypothetical protein